MVWGQSILGKIGGYPSASCCQLCFTTKEQSLQHSPSQMAGRSVSRVAQPAVTSVRLRRSSQFSKLRKPRPQDESQQERQLLPPSLSHSPERLNSTRKRKDSIPKIHWRRPEPRGGCVLNPTITDLSHPLILSRIGHCYQEKASGFVMSSRRLLYA